jgi:hypothetical protein
MKAIEKCTDEHDRMHCDDVKCEGPEEVAADEDDTDEDNSGWICTLKPFVNEYMAAADSRAEAKLKAMKKCEAIENKMFCKEPKCKEG